jgi:hypothetical protein
VASTIGFGVGFTQWLIFRPWINRAGWWIATNVVALTIAFILPRRVDYAADGCPDEALEQIAQGHTNSDIAERLNITSKTVGNHVSNIFGKLQVTNREKRSCGLATRGWATSTARSGDLIGNNG